MFIIMHFVGFYSEYIVGRGLKTKSWNIKTRIAELGVFMHKFAIENDPKP